jgi:hypothetical protein
VKGPLKLTMPFAEELPATVWVIDQKWELRAPPRDANGRRRADLWELGPVAELRRIQATRIRPAWCDDVQREPVSADVMVNVACGYATPGDWIWGPDGIVFVVQERGEA